jgi:hypothetical protein
MLRWSMVAVFIVMMFHCIQDAPGGKINFLGVIATVILSKKVCISLCIQCASGGKVNILESHTIGHSKKKSTNVHVSYSERFPR